MDRLVFGVAPDGFPVAECELAAGETGLLPALIEEDAVRRLILGACAYLGPGPATVETWGEPAAPYLALGFELAEEDRGWELLLAPG